jgi:hypothetical protein
MTAQACDHWEQGWGTCGAPDARRYLPGVRCPAHTPAAIAGRAETVPDPARTLEGLRAAWVAAQAATR